MQQQCHSSNSNTANTTVRLPAGGAVTQLLASEAGTRGSLLSLPLSFLPSRLVIRHTNHLPCHVGHCCWRNSLRKLPPPSCTHIPHSRSPAQARHRVCAAAIVQLLLLLPPGSKGPPGAAAGVVVLHRPREPLGRVVHRAASLDYTGRRVSLSSPVGGKAGQGRAAAARSGSVSALPTAAGG